MTCLEEKFTGPIDARLTRLEIGHAAIEREPGRVRLIVDGAIEGQLSDAELNDLHGQGREGLPWTPPLRMEIRARTSHPAGALIGTAGFGFWNNPFDPSDGVVAAPNVVWFFYASPPSNMPFVPGGAPHGWKAGMLNGGHVGRVALVSGLVALRIPLINRLIYRAARSARLRAGERLLDEVDLSVWHDYALEWGLEAAVFWVDGREVYRVVDPPRVRLGFTAWLDNNCLIERAGGSLAWQRLAVPQRQWLELASIRIDKTPEKC